MVDLIGLILIGSTYLVIIGIGLWMEFKREEDDD